MQQKNIWSSVLMYFKMCTKENEKNQRVVFIIDMLVDQVLLVLVY